MTLLTIKSLNWKKSLKIYRYYLIIFNIKILVLWEYLIIFVEKKITLKNKKKYE